MSLQMSVFVCACVWWWWGHVFVHLCVYSVCSTSMRDSLKHSFIQKYSVQGEKSDELFRNISHSQKKGVFGG